MSDDLRIPAIATGPNDRGAGRAPTSTSYRARRVGRQSHTRAIAIGGAALAALLLAGVGTWAVMGRRTTAIPMIEADTRPIRVKPDNAGGMQVVGADEQVLGGQSSGSDRMAPAPETPAPQALRAQMQQASTSPSPTPATAQAPGASPLADTPSPAVVTRAPAQAAARPTPNSTSAAAGTTMVQLAAVDTEPLAQAEWQRLAKRMPDLMANKRLVTQKVERDGRTLWRIRTTGFTDIADATSFCAKVKAKGGNCVIAS